MSRRRTCNQAKHFQVLETHNGLTGLIAEAAKVKHPKRRSEAPQLALQRAVHSFTGEAASDRKP